MNFDLGGTFTALQLSISLNLTFSAISSFFDGPLQLELRRCRALTEDIRLAIDYNKSIGDTKNVDGLGAIYIEAEAFEGVVKNWSRTLNKLLYYPCRYLSLVSFVISSVLFYFLYANNCLKDNPYFIVASFLTLVPVLGFGIIFAVLPVVVEIYCRGKNKDITDRSNQF